MLRGLNILVAEDNALNQKLLSIILSRQHAAFAQAFTGRQAIEFLEKQHFDIVIMDLHMPDMNGFETAAYIRNVMKNQTPIIALTAGLLVDEQDKCLAAGMDACLSKPIDADDLCKNIISIINNHKKRTS